MFSNLILRNSRRSRKENGLFFSSLVISIVAFYMILSISTQDVMLFLQKMESDAVDKLLLLIPAFYGMTLGILFFLIYFACKYQFERRRHEFGVYLMLGMRRSKLFGMLLAEDFLTSILAMLIGLPVAVVLSEIVSLVTAKLVGMGIIGHQFSLSWFAIEWTLAGFLAIKLTALLILSGRISRQEIGTLLSQPTNRPKKQMPSVIYGLAAICGSVMLEVLRNGGIDEISSIYHLDRLFDRLSSNRCPIHSSADNSNPSVVLSQDVNTSYVTEDDLSYQDLKELNEVKIPVNVLLMAILHMVHGDNDDRVKAIFRLFKEYKNESVLI